MNFEAVMDTITWAKKLHDLTNDVMYREAIKVLSPLLTQEQGTLDIQQQTAMTYMKCSINQYHGLFGYPSVPEEA